MLCVCPSLGGWNRLFFEQGSRNLVLGICLGGGSKVVVAPGIDLLRQSRLRLDLMSILFERRFFLRFEVNRYLMIDASSHFGYNLQCIREDRTVVPAELSADIFRRAGLDLLPYYESRICPLSTSGHGGAGLRKHITNAINTKPCMVQYQSQAGFATNVS